MNNSAYAHRPPASCDIITLIKYYLIQFVCECLWICTAATKCISVNWAKKLSVFILDGCNESVLPLL